MQRERRHLETFNNPGRSEQQGPLPERRHGRQTCGSPTTSRTAPGQSWAGVGISKVNLQHRIGPISRRTTWQPCQVQLGARETSSQQQWTRLSR
ncbi:unnamed protein product [Sphagnum tenellum]